MATRRSNRGPAKEEAGLRVEFSLENLLLEINRKLDDLGTSMQSKANAADLDRVEATVADMQRRGTDVAQQAMSKATALEVKLQTLETETATSHAVLQTQQSLEQVARHSRYQWATIALGFAGILLKWFWPH
jgi:hypothetical protein